MVLHAFNLALSAGDVDFLPDADADVDLDRVDDVDFDEDVDLFDDDEAVFDDDSKGASEATACLCNA